MPTHPTAAAGFGNAPPRTSEAGPSYPDDAVAYLAAELGLGPATRVLDLAAGTGKLTRLLSRAAPTWSPWSRSRRCGRSWRRRCPGARRSRARPRRSRFRTASVDAVTVAQAFHWFDAGTALARDPPRAPPGRRARPDLERLRTAGAGVGGRPARARRRRARLGAAVRPLAVARRVHVEPALHAARRADVRTSCRSSTRTAWSTGSRSTSYIAALPEAERAAAVRTGPRARRRCAAADPPALPHRRLHLQVWT